MKIPEHPREIIRFIMIIFMIGLIPTLFIYIFSTHPYWDYVKTLFTTDSWNYLNWWLIVFPEPAAGFLAIYAAFAIEKRERNRDFLQRVREILPYIYFELLENKSHIEDFLKNPEEFNQKFKQFNDTSWEMFKDDIKKWQEQNVVPLSRIYFHLSYVNRKLENYTVKSDNIEIIKRVRISKGLIEKQLETYESKYFTIEKNMSELHKVFDIYMETSIMDEELQEYTVLKLETEKLHSIMKKKIADVVIKKLVDSPNFATSNRQAQLLIKYKPFTVEQLNIIINGFINNFQVSDGFDSKRIIIEIYKENKELIKPELVTKFKEMVDFTDK